MACATIEMTGQNGETVFHGKLTALPLSDRYIVEQSTKLFQEDEPCVIYRSFIRKKALLEIDDFLRGAARGGRTELAWEQVPEPIRRMFQEKPSVQKIAVMP